MRANIEIVEAWKTTDGRLFEDRGEAIDHQANMMFGVDENEGTAREYKQARERLVHIS